jgi:hypothetical protein
LVVLNEAVARWARASIDLGHPGFTLKPIVISAGQIPQIVDEGEARRSPHLAVLSALAHPRLPVASAAISGLEGLPEEQSRLYYDAVLAGLPHFDRQILEAQMQGYQYRSLFARTFIKQGREEGREEGREAGREEGREAGREEGRHEGKQLAALELAEAKLGRLAVEEESAILSMQEEAQLSALIVGLGQARNRREAKAAMPLALAVRV